MTIPSAERYGLAHRVIHWVMAIAILTAIPLGLVMGRVSEGPLQNNLYDLHKSLGVLVLVLAITRIAIKRSQGVPAPAPGLPSWQYMAST